MSCKYSESAAIGIFLIVASCFMDYLYKLAGEEVVLITPFLLRPDYEISTAWYLKFLGINLGKVLALLGVLFLIPEKQGKYRLAAKVVAFYGFLHMALFFLNFNNYPTEAALALLLLTLSVVVLYCNGRLTWLPKIYYRYFPQLEEVEIRENQITHP